MAQHAILSASSASRWLACTPSAVLAAKAPKTSSVYADEGTLAHSLAELILRKGLDGGAPTKAELKKIKDNALYTKEMPGQVEKFTNYVFEQIAGSTKQAGQAPIVMLETRVDFSDAVPKGFGTADVIIANTGGMKIVDLKYGKGVQVDAAGNAQMRLYAWGALRKLDYKENPKAVIEMTIGQPRLDHFDTEILTYQELKDWIENTVKPTAKIAASGEGELVVGDHCKFCPVQATCRAMAEYNLSLARFDFQDPYMLAIAEVAEVYRKLPLLKTWAEKVGEYALEQAKAGVQIPGFKLVEGKGRREWKDESTIADTLELFFPAEDIYNTKLKGLGDIEGLMAKDMFDTLLGPLVGRRSGAPVLVDAADKRPALGVESAIQDFS